LDLVAKKATSYFSTRLKKRTKNREKKEHFEEHLNEGSESEQPTRPIDLRDDGDVIDLSSREEIEGALKYLKNNKAFGADSIASTVDLIWWMPYMK
jgi:hypothetical protein